MSMRSGVTPELKLSLTLTLTLTNTEGAVLSPDPNARYRSLHITWQQHHNCRIVCELSLCILICILPGLLKCDIVEKSIVRSITHFCKSFCVYRIIIIIHGTMFIVLSSWLESFRELTRFIWPWTSVCRTQFWAIAATDKCSNSVLMQEASDMCWLRLLRCPRTVWFIAYSLVRTSSGCSAVNCWPWTPVFIQTQSLALRKRKPQETQALAFLAVFVYATQAIAFEWKPGLSYLLALPSRTFHLAAAAMWYWQAPAALRPACSSSVA